MTLVERISATITLIGADIKALFARTLPAGGAAGNVLMKSAAGDYVVAWGALTAAPGGKDYGALSVAVQYFTEAKKLFDVPASAFMPPPAVDSAVILCTMRTTAPVSVPSEKLFFRVVRAAFGQRRKTLANSLQGCGFDKAAVTAMLKITGIDGQRRGETLSMEEFASLSRAYHD